MILDVRGRLPAITAVRVQRQFVFRRAERNRKRNVACAHREGVFGGSAHDLAVFVKESRKRVPACGDGGKRHGLPFDVIFVQRNHTAVFIFVRNGDIKFLGIFRGKGRSGVFISPRIYHLALTVGHAGAFGVVPAVEGISCKTGNFDRGRAVIDNVRDFVPRGAAVEIQGNGARKLGVQRFVAVTALGNFRNGRIRKGFAFAPAAENVALHFQRRQVEIVCKLIGSVGDDFRSAGDELQGIRRKGPARVVLGISAFVANGGFGNGVEFLRTEPAVQRITGVFVFRNGKRLVFVNAFAVFFPLFHDEGDRSPALPEAVNADVAGDERAVGRSFQRDVFGHAHRPAAEVHLARFVVGQGGVGIDAFAVLFYHGFASARAVVAVERDFIFRLTDNRNDGFFVKPEGSGFRGCGHIIVVDYHAFRNHHVADFPAYELIAVSHFRQGKFRHDVAVFDLDARLRQSAVFGDGKRLRVRDSAPSGVQRDVRRQSV